LQKSVAGDPRRAESVCAAIFIYLNDFNRLSVTTEEPSGPRRAPSIRENQRSAEIKITSLQKFAAFAIQIFPNTR
jgi:hypothetical protein